MPYRLHHADDVAPCGLPPFELWHDGAGPPEAVGAFWTVEEARAAAEAHREARRAPSSAADPAA